MTVQNDGGAAATPITCRFAPGSPVELGPAATEPEVPEPGSALCLSGGGYRAMLFHTGALWRLCEMGYLSSLKRVSSVSGGSIVAAQLALKWRQIAGSGGGVAAFEADVVLPIRRLASRSIDWRAILAGLLLPGSASDRIAGSYRRQLYGDATLQDLPSDADGPRFVINASNLQSGALWRFMRPYMRDWRVGEVKAPRLRVATAVAASSAFPPVLSPCVLRLDPAEFTPGLGEELHQLPYLSRVVLTDGGVYDNLGLETVWKRYRTVVVSNGGGQMASDPNPPLDWLRHTRRVLDLIDNQVGALRKREVIAALKLSPRDPSNPGWRDGTYWGIRSDAADYPVPNQLPCPKERTMALASVPTRLKALPDPLQERLINWGYAICDAAMRRWVVPKAAPAAGFPYPAAGVG